MLRSFGSVVTTDAPLNWMSPPVGDNNPAIKFKIVDFPHPLGPSKHTKSPCSIEKFTDFNASKPLSNTLFKSITSIMTNPPVSFTSIHSILPCFLSSEN